MIGLTFQVYSPRTGITQEGEGKGEIVIADVASDTAGCRILREESDDPIVPGDLIGNLVFDPDRVYTFVVKGAFDLYGSGRAKAEGAQEVKMLIDRFGGEVTEEIGVQTDFVVLGERPTEPTRPAESAPAQVWQAYNEQMRVHQQYNEVQRIASSLQIPILNANRFLAFIGYTPSRAGG
jgi:hypothetical protein